MIAEATEPENEDEIALPGTAIQSLKAFDEDDWLAIQIGEVKFMVYEPCPRCKMIGTQNSPLFFEIY